MTVVEEYGPVCDDNWLQNNVCGKIKTNLHTNTRNTHTYTRSSLHYLHPIPTPIPIHPSMSSSGDTQANAQAKNITADLVSLLRTSLPGDYEIEAADIALNFLSESYVGDWYRRTLVPRADRVLRRDETLLQTVDWGEDALVMDALKSVWDRLDDGSRTAVWAKLGVIVRILRR